MLIDSHAHIQMKPFAADRDAVLQRAREAGVAALVVPGTDVATSREAVDLAHQYDGVYATVGTHPHDAESLDDDAMAALRALAANERVVALGEMGLDYYRDLAPRAAQREAFERQLALAAEVELPVVVHDRDAHDDTFELLERWAAARRAAGATGPLGVRHCWSGPVDLAQAYQQIGFMISIAGNVTYPAAADIRAVARAVVDDWLLIETDCPYLAPIPRRGKRNEPAYVARTATYVAELRGESAARIAQLTADNARRLFRIPAPAARPVGGTA